MKTVHRGFTRHMMYTIPHIIVCMSVSPDSSDRLLVDSRVKRGRCRFPLPRTSTNHRAIPRYPRDTQVVQLCCSLEFSPAASPHPNPTLTVTIHHLCPPRSRVKIPCSPTWDLLGPHGRFPREVVGESPRSRQIPCGIPRDPTLCILRRHLAYIRSYHNCIERPAATRPK